MSQIFFDELGIPEPAYRLDLRTSDTDGDDRRRSARSIEARAARLGARLRRHELDRWPGRAPPARRCRSRTSRPASGASTCRCPRSETGSRSTGCGPPPLPRRALGGAARAEGVPGRREVVGDVMADATRLFAPVARAPRARACEPPYAVLTIHRQANTEPDRLRRIVAALDGRATAASSSRCTRARATPSTSTGSRLPAQRRARSSRSATSRCSRSSPRADVVVTDSGGLQKEAYWLARPVRHVAPEHRVGRHGRRPARTGSSSPTSSPPRSRRRASRTHAPPLYGDGHASGTHRRRPVRLTAVPEQNLYDVAVIGAGYVGLPLAVTFAEAGQRVLAHRRAATRSSRR